jgi:hypothetical protein
MLALPEIPPHQAGIISIFKLINYYTIELISINRYLNQVVNSDICCPIDMPVPINIFAARVHAHGLGTVVTSYKYDPEVIGIELLMLTGPFNTLN